MAKKKFFLVFIPCIILLSCKKYDFQKEFPSYLIEASEIAMRSINETFKISNKPEVIRFVATYSATLLADEAIKLLLKKQTDKLSILFGKDKTNAALSIFLKSYCLPLVNDIIAEEIDFRLKNPQINPSENRKQRLDSIVNVYIDKYNLRDPVGVLNEIHLQLEELLSQKNIKKLMNANSDTFAVCRNWKDNGVVYQYRIKDKRLEMKRGDSEWVNLSLPQNMIPIKIAADNNRCFVLTENKELWWYCVKEDQAKWSLDIMKTAVEVMALKEILGEGICSDIVMMLDKIVETTIKETSLGSLLKNFYTVDTMLTKEYWAENCKAWAEIALAIDGLLLKSGEGKPFSAKDYTEWSYKAHRKGAWSNLLKWEANGVEFTRGKNINIDSIVDIAVGNWNGTVVTMYVIANGKVWFIDEEIIHPQWKPIEQWNSKWAVIAKEYHNIENSPYPLDSNCRIDASNSVISILKNNNNETHIYWIRWDYHQKDDFVYWPLDWCEHKWYDIKAPVNNVFSFSIRTNGTIDPRLDNTVWSVPAPAFTFHNYLPKAGYEGIFGDVPPSQVSAYPVDVFIKNSEDTTYHLSLEKTEELSNSSIVWKNLSSF